MKCTTRQCSVDLWARSMYHHQLNSEHMQQSEIVDDIG